MGGSDRCVFPTTYHLLPTTCLMKAEEYSERQLEVHGWPLRLTSYRLGEVFYCKADNVSPGAQIARTHAASREEAEQKALAIASERLGRTRRQAR